MFTVHRFAACAVCVLLALATAEAQMTHRLKGSIRTDARDLASKAQRAALAAAIGDLQQIARIH